MRVLGSVLLLSERMNDMDESTRLYDIGYSPAFIQAIRDIVARDDNYGKWAEDCEKREGIPVSFWRVAEEMCLSTEDDRYSTDWVWVVESAVRRRACRALVFLLGSQ